MNENEAKLNNQRITFSRKIKRKVLLEFAKGKNAQDALFENINLSFEDVSKDKKYAAKLIHKWRKEMYENKEILNILNHNITDKMLEEEIDNLGSDDETEEDITSAEIDNLRENFEKIINGKNSN